MFSPFSSLLLLLTFLAFTHDLLFLLYLSHFLFPHYFAIEDVFQKLWYMLRHKHLLIALVVGCGLQAIQQLSGVNTIV